MGKYRATLNMPGVKRFAIGEFDDDDPRVIPLVLEGHLQPMDISDEMQDKIAAARTAPRKVSPNSVDAVKNAMKAARERQEAAEAAEAADAPQTAEEAPEATEEAPEAAEESPEEEMVPEFTSTVSTAFTASDPEPEDESTSTQPPKTPPTGRGPSKRGGGR
jgi:hypothetical protein